MPNPDLLHAQLIRAFPGAEVEVIDLTGTQDHFRAVVVAQEFHGKSRVEQHRMVYQALGDLMRGPVHALALTTRAPKNDGTSPASPGRGREPDDGTNER